MRTAPISARRRDSRPINPLASMRNVLSPGSLSGLPATGIGSFYCRVKHYKGDDRDKLAKLYRKSAQFLQVDREYSRLFPGCEDTWQMGVFTAARERILLDHTVAALHDGSVTNVVVLASGLSPLIAYLSDYVHRKLPHRGINIIATDLRDPLLLQRSLCRFLLEDKNLPKRNKPSFQVLDVLRAGDWEALRKKLIAGGVAVICEGLLGYFYLDQAKVVLEQVPNVTSSPGSFFLTDIATRAGVNNTIFTGDSARLLSEFYRLAGVDPNRLAFENGGDCLEYLRAQGYHAARARMHNPDDFFVPPEAKETSDTRAKLGQILRSTACIKVQIPH